MLGDFNASISQGRDETISNHTVLGNEMIRNDCLEVFARKTKTNSVSSVSFSSYPTGNCTLRE